MQLCMPFGQVYPRVARTKNYMTPKKSQKTFYWSHFILLSVYDFISVIILFLLTSSVGSSHYHSPSHLNLIILSLLISSSISICNNRKMQVRYKVCTISFDCLYVNYKQSHSLDIILLNLFSISWIWHSRFLLRLHTWFQDLNTKGSASSVFNKAAPPAKALLL